MSEKKTNDIATIKTIMRALRDMCSARGMLMLYAIASTYTVRTEPRLASQTILRLKLKA